MPFTSDNSSVICECGSLFLWKSRYAHRKSLKHKRYIAFCNDKKPPTAFNQIETIMEGIEDLNSQTIEELKCHLTQINNILKE